MRPLGYYGLKIVRATSWPLMVLLAGFLLTGYMISGRFGLGALADEKTAQAVHKLLHLPLILLVLAHSASGVYLALRRWRWIKR
jgi:hypothetical protein